MNKQKLKKHININQITKKLQGRNGLRSTKPKEESGLIRFIWRMAQFDCGKYKHMPVMAYYELQEWVDEKEFDARVITIIDDEGNEILDYLDEVIEKVLKNLGEDSLGAVKTWHNLI